MAKSKIAPWPQAQPVTKGLALLGCAEDVLYAALDDVCARQEKIELALYRLYQRRRGAQPPRLFLYDVTSSYLEGQGNELGEFGYNRDGKRGKLQIVIGLLTDAEGEPLAERGFAGHTADTTTVAEQHKVIKEQFPVGERVVGRVRGME